MAGCNCGGSKSVTPKKGAAKRPAKKTPAKKTIKNKSMSNRLSKIATKKATRRANANAKGCRC